MTLNHLHLKVKDIKKSMVFYNKLFGFEEKVRFSNEFVFIQDKAGFDLALVQVPDVKSLPDGIHFGFSVASKSEMMKVFHRVQDTYRDNLEADQPSDHSNWGSFICFDPDRYPIEVYWDSSLH